MVVIGDKIYYFKIKVDFIKDSVEFKMQGEHEVIGINEDEGILVINDNSFTKLNLSKPSRYSIHNYDLILQKPKVYHFKFDKYDELVAEYYTLNNSEKSAKKVMKKALEKYIDEKFGRYMSKSHLLDQIEV